MDANFPYHREKTVGLKVSAQDLFAFLDNHKNLSAHMDKPSAMMGGGSIKTEFDKGNGKAVGSHIKMYGKAFGLSLYLDEVIMVYNPPTHKQWQTVGDVKLIVIGHYVLGFRIHEQDGVSHLTVFIDYEHPHSFIGKILGFLLGWWYANWCIDQMVNAAVKEFPEA